MQSRHRTDSMGRAGGAGANDASGARAAGSPELGQAHALRELCDALDRHGRRSAADVPAPPRDLIGSVTASIHARPNALERVREWLSADAAASGTLLDAYLDRRLSRRQLAALRALAARDDEVALALRGWQRMRGELAALPLHEPAADFADRVMARVRADQAAGGAREGRPARAWRRRAAALSRLRGPLPALAGIKALWASGQHRLAAAAGLAVGPVSAFAGIAAAVFVNHPQLTLAGLASYLWTRAGAGAASLAAQVADSAREAAAQIGLAGVPVSAAAPLVLGSLTLVAGMTLAAAWVLYRNLVPNRKASGRHAPRRHAHR